LKIKRTYAGNCNACGRETKYLERDHRVPVRLGGGQTHHNLQDLCLDCHHRKSALEASLMSFSCESEVVREWLKLAFQDDTDSMKEFADEVYLRSKHLLEIISRLKESIVTDKER
jgi:Restriction endonuclease